MKLRLSARNVGAAAAIGLREGIGGRCLVDIIIGRNIWIWRKPRQLTV